MTFGPELLAIGVILIFGGIVFLMIRASRQALQKKNQQTQRLGFSVLEEAPSNLEIRVEELYKSTPNQTISVKNVYHQKDFQGDIYLFDVVDTHGEDSDLGSEVFGVISQDLALPRFSMTTVPDFNRDSLLGGLMEKLLDKVMALAEKYQGLQRVELPGRPEYEDNFIIFGRDPIAVQNLFSRISLSSFRKGSLPIQIGGSGDFLTVDFSIAQAQGTERTDLSSQYQHFRDIIRAFR
jgi:hypothetical protein